MRLAPAAPRFTDRPAAGHASMQASPHTGAALRSHSNTYVLLHCCPLPAPPPPPHPPPWPPRMWAPASSTTPWLWVSASVLAAPAWRRPLARCCARACWRTWVRVGVVVVVRAAGGEEGGCRGQGCCLCAGVLSPPGGLMPLPGVLSPLAAAPSVRWAAAGCPHPSGARASHLFAARCRPCHPRSPCTGPPARPLQTPTTRLAQWAGPFRRSKLLVQAQQDRPVQVQVQVPVRPRPGAPLPWTSRATHRCVSCVGWCVLGGSSKASAPAWPLPF